MTCSPRRMMSSEGTGCGLLARDSSENRSDRHPDSRYVALSEDVAGHDLTGGENVGRRPAVAHHYAGARVDLETEIREGDPGPQRVPEKRRRVDPPGPVALVRKEAFGSAVVQDRMVERPRAHGVVEPGHCTFQLFPRQIQRGGQVSNRPGHDGREYRRHEGADGLRIDDGVRDLI